MLDQNPNNPTLFLDNDNESCQPLIKSTLQSAIENANGTQTPAGNILLPHGTVVGPTGVSTPNTQYIKWIMMGITLALLSGASGFEGADEAGGLGIGLGGWLATSALNGNGIIDFLLKLLTQGFGSGCGMAVAIVAGFLLAAMPPAVLSGRGAIETVFGENGLDNMTPLKWSVGGIFGGVNFMVSGGLNVMSLVNLAPGFKDYFKRIFGSFETTRIWQSNMAEFAIRGVLILSFVPSLFAALMATIARGHDTFNFFVAVLEKWGVTNEGMRTAIGYGVFSATSFPGFAMFLYGLLKLTLFIENIIHFVLVRRKNRRFNFKGTDMILGTVAFGLAITFAFFVYENYQGLAKEAYDGEWALGELIRYVLGSVNIFTYASSSAAGINLVQRSVNFERYMQGARAYFRSRKANSAQLAQEKANANEIHEQFIGMFPGSPKTMKNFMDAIAGKFDVRSNETFA